MENVQVSIIIPVYNASKYLHECLESICFQTFQDIEMICINDGSTDDSLEILKEFQHRDTRIIIIDQKNQGVSAARNAGLEIAIGKYVGFVDSDDTINSDYFQKLFITAEKNNADVVFCIAFTRDDLEKNKIYHKEDIIKEILPLYLNKDIYNSVCNKLYVNKLIKDHSIEFPLGKKLGEDATFNLQFLKFTNKLYYLDFGGYHYREVTGSATRNVSTQNYLENAVALYNDEPPDFIKNNFKPERIYNLKSNRFIHYIISLVYIYSEPGNGLSVIQKIKKLYELVNEVTVTTVFSQDNLNSFPDFGRFQKQIYYFIKSKGVFPLYFLSLYSYYRNL